MVEDTRSSGPREPREYIGPFLVRMLTDEQQRLYKTNAWFRLGVDQITMVLPTILAGLAAVAEERNAEQQKAMAVLMKGVPRA